MKRPVRRNQNRDRRYLESRSPSSKMGEQKLQHVAELASRLCIEGYQGVLVFNSKDIAYAPIELTDDEIHELLKYINIWINVHKMPLINLDKENEQP